MKKAESKQQLPAQSGDHFDPFYRNLIDRIDEGVVVVKPEGTILFSNRRFANIVKVPVEEIVGVDISRFIASHGKKRFEAMSQKRGRDEISLRTAGGRLVQVYLSVSDMEIGEKDEICIVVSLLTEQRHREQAMVAGKWAAAILTQSSEVIIVCNENGQITQASSVARRFFPRRLLWKFFDEVCPLTFVSVTPGKRDKFSISSVLEGKILRSLEVTHEQDNGQIFHFLLSARPLVETNRISGCFVTLTDITERKRMEDELRRSHAELEERVRERTTELAMKNEQIQESEDRLRLLSSQLLSVQETERTRIAMEIHDSFTQSLATIKFRAENILNEMRGNDCADAIKPLQSLMPIIQTSIDEARRLQQELRPSILDDLGIQATLTWFCREFQVTHPAIRIEQEMEIQGQLPKDLKIVVYRIIQEAMNNVAKHSGADRVHLSLKKTDHAIELVIRDNGRGFDTEEILSWEGAKRGMGLSSMKERAELSKGTLLIESVIGKGATIKVTWHL